MSDTEGFVQVYIVDYSMIIIFKFIIINLLNFILVINT